MISGEIRIGKVDEKRQKQGAYLVESGNLIIGYAYYEDDQEISYLSFY